MPEQPPPPPPALEVSGITKHYDAVTANEDVALTVQAGEIVGLLGENGAGKSTLVKVLAGMVKPDHGEVQVDGRDVPLGDAVRARAAGIGVVHQHFMLVPNMTATENVALSLGTQGDWIMKKDELAKKIADLGDEYGLKVRPNTLVGGLPVGEQQRVEILKTLLLRPKVLILDEPSAVLTPQEWSRLARVLKELAADGFAIVVITHKLAEVAEIADRCVVMRAGRMVGDVLVKDTSADELATLMVGRAVNLLPQHVTVEPGQTVLEVRGLTLEREGSPAVGPVDLTVAAGEVLGIAGVEGNGQTELAELICGQRQATSGTVEIHSTRQSGPGTLGVVSEDRQKDGLALTLSIEDNLMMRAISRPAFQRFGVLNAKAIREHCAALVQRFDVRTPSAAVIVGSLSGGNQQKVVLARELEHKPDLLVVSQPTRGLDVGAIEFVHRNINEHKERGSATLLFSAELDEVLGLSDRVAVMFEGAIVATLRAEEATREVVGRLMAGDTAAIGVDAA